ncbi:hypothetical protein M3Y94_01021900 [Aphelenchoides besseyi]|nr:hypothetical protein M3Y94_01021900 [Aphelenchoides besseyi]KAI6216865.1 hypothetical protein M3Y95_01254400 [Aphelenchoides besseyi]
MKLRSQSSEMISTMKALILLFSIVHLSFLLPSKLPSTGEPCDMKTVDCSFTADQFSVGSYTSSRYRLDEYTNDTNFLQLEHLFFIAVMDKMNARLDHGLYRVKCDNQSMASYPDIIFTVNGFDIVANQRIIFHCRRILTIGVQRGSQLHPTTNM